MPYSRFKLGFTFTPKPGNRVDCNWQDSVESNLNILPIEKSPPFRPGIGPPLEFTPHVGPEPGAASGSIQFQRSDLQIGRSKMSRANVGYSLRILVCLGLILGLTAVACGGSNSGCSRGYGGATHRRPSSGMPGITAEEVAKMMEETRAESAGLLRRGGPKVGGAAGS